MKESDNRFGSPGALICENSVEALAALAKVPERIGADRYRPIHSDGDPANIRTFRAITEGHFGKIGQAGMFEFGLLVIECLGRDAEIRKLLGEMFLADRTKKLWIHRRAVLTHFGQKRAYAIASSVELGQG
jgi:hypothetical protein